MITSDIDLPKDGSWVTVTLSGSSMWVCNMSRNDILVRIGVASQSDGFILAPKQTIALDETCYARVQKSGSYDGKLAVTQ